MSNIKIKTEKGEIKLNEFDVLLIVEEYYKEIEPVRFKDQHGYELDEHIDIIIDELKMKPSIKIIK
jgi:hypothetical protein